MPLFTIVRLFFVLVSLAVLATAGYLLWSWWESGAVFGDAASEMVRQPREDWRLWTGLALLAWSVAGRFAVLTAFARTSKPTDRFERGAGRTIGTSDGATLHLEEEGAAQARCIILTHGQGLDATAWAPYRAALAKTYRVITWDLPGLGRSSSGNRESLSVAAAAAALRELVLNTARRPVILVGHSFGGMAIQELAQADGEFFQRWVAGVVLLHTTHTNPLRTMILSDLALALQKPALEPLSAFTTWIQPIAWLSNWQSYLSGSAHLANRLQFGPDVTRRQLDHTTLLSTKSPPRAIEQRNVRMYHWRGLSGTGVDVPAIVVGGASDIVTKPEASHTIATMWPRASLHVVPSANHLTPFERYEDYARLMAEFADSLRPEVDTDDDKPYVVIPGKRDGLETRPLIH